MSPTEAIPVRVLDLQGTPYERGRQHGEQLEEQICELMMWQAKAWELNLSSEVALQAYADKYLPYTAEYAPDLLEEMRGIADGAGVTLSEVLRLNCFLDLGDGLITGNFGRLFGGCTAFAVNGNVTDDGCTYVGQNYDLPGFFSPALVLLRLPTRHGGHVLAQTFAGCLGCSGINSHGIALTINKLNATDGKPGVPYTLVVRQALDKMRLGDAMGAILGARRASGVNYVLGDTLEVVDIETSAEQSAVVYASEDYLFHTNHYLSPYLKSLKIEQWPAAPELLGESHVRYMRMGRQLRDAARHGKVTSRDLLGMASDHSNYPYSICNHIFEEKQGQNLGSVNTVATVIYKPATGDVLVTNGNPCRSPAEHLTVEPRS